VRILKKVTEPRYIREEGITSYLLASSITSDAEFLTTSLVEIMPGGKQRIHSHIPEQIYYIFQGTGLMTVSNETEQIYPGDCIFISSSAPHGLENNGDVLLKYFSAAAPSFEKEQLKKFWPLSSETEMNEN